MSSCDSFAYKLLPTYCLTAYFISKNYVTRQYKLLNQDDTYKFIDVKEDVPIVIVRFENNTEWITFRIKDNVKVSGNLLMSPATPIFLSVTNYHEQALPNLITHIRKVYETTDDYDLLKIMSTTFKTFNFIFTFNPESFIKLSFVNNKFLTKAPFESKFDIDEMREELDCSTLELIINGFVVRFTCGLHTTAGFETLFEYMPDMGYEKYTMKVGYRDVIDICVNDRDKDSLTTPVLKNIRILKSDGTAAQYERWFERLTVKEYSFAYNLMITT